MICRTILEWQTIKYGNHPDEIPVAVADRIANVAASLPLAGRGGNGILEHGRKGLRARGMVGVVAAEGGVLEILPKIDVIGEEGSTATGEHSSSACKHARRSAGSQHRRGADNSARLAARHSIRNLDQDFLREAY